MPLCVYTTVLCALLHECSAYHYSVCLPLPIQDVDAALESLKSVIVPDSPLPTLSKDKDTTTLTITNTVKPDTSCETVQEVPMETVPALVASVNQS